MSDHSNIEWTDTTWNPTTGCTRVSPGCDNCYAVRMTRRCEGSQNESVRSRYIGLTVKNPAGQRHFNGVVRWHEDVLETPLHWRKPRRVFVNSMSDLFHKDVPFEFIDKVFAVMALCPQHTFQVLTKRPERMAEYMAGRADGASRWACVACRLDEMATTLDGRRPSGIYLDDDGWPLPNVWLGTSVENQEQADKRIPHLLKCPAAVRFLSVEPLLGPVDLARSVAIARHRDLDVMMGMDSRWLIDWVIVGGESGAGARQCPTEWIKSIVDQCRAADTPCFVKQLGSKPVWVGALKFHPIKLKDSKGGEPAEWPPELRIRQMPRVAAPREEALS